MLIQPTSTTNLTQATEELLAQPLLRVFLGATAGYGETQASANTYHWLRSLGYRNKIEIIYTDMAVSSVANLFGLPEAFSVLQPWSLDELPTTFISLSYFEKNEKAFSLCEWILAGSNIAPITAAAFKANACLFTFAPPFANKIGWKMGGEFQVEIHTLDAVVSGIPYPIPTLSQLQTRFAQSMAISSHTRSVFNALLALTRTNQTIVSVYGMHVNFRGMSKPEIVIPNLIEAFDMVSNLQPDLVSKQRFFLLFNDFSSEDNENIQKRLIHACYIQIDDCHFLEKIDAWSEVNNIVINVGSIPSDLFRYLVSHSLLFVGEGLSAQSLSMVTGTPFLHRGYYKEEPSPLIIDIDSIERERIVPVLIKQNATQLIRQLIQTRQALANKRSILSTQSNAGIIAQFIRDCYDPTTLLAHYHQQLQQQFYANNPLLYGMLACKAQNQTTIPEQYSPPLRHSNVVFNDEHEIIWPVHIKTYTLALQANPPSFQSVLAAIFFDLPFFKIRTMLDTISPLAPAQWEQAALFSALADKPQWVNYFLKPDTAIAAENLRVIASCQNISLFERIVSHHFLNIPQNRTLNFRDYRAFFQAINRQPDQQNEKHDLVKRYYQPPSLNLNDMSRGPRRSTNQCSDVQHVASSAFFKPVKSVSILLGGAIATLASTADNKVLPSASFDFSNDLIPKLPPTGLLLFLSGASLALVCLMLYLVVSHCPVGSTHKKAV